MQASMNSHCACVCVWVCACVCVQVTTYVRLCADYYLFKSTWRTTTSFHTLTLDIDRAKQIFLNCPRFFGYIHASVRRRNVALQTRPVATCRFCFLK